MQLHHTISTSTVTVVRRFLYKQCRFQLNDVHVYNVEMSGLLTIAIQLHQCLLKSTNLVQVYSYGQFISWL